MSQTQKYPLALAYHILWTSSEDVTHLSVFGHIARLTQGTLAHSALHWQVGLASGRPCRPRARWTAQLCNDTGSVPANLWRQPTLRGHGGATQNNDTGWLRDDDDETL